jgi:hypothetical protein
VRALRAALPYPLTNATLPVAMFVLVKNQPRKVEHGCTHTHTETGAPRRLRWLQGGELWHGEVCFEICANIEMFKAALYSAVRNMFTCSIRTCKIAMSQLHRFIIINAATPADSTQILCQADSPLLQGDVLIHTSIMLYLQALFARRPS